MSEKTPKTIRIKWVRSGIGFTYLQKAVVRSLGLNKLNQTVVRPDTPQIRGIVAAVPHLLEIVPTPPVPPWASVPEYAVHAPVAAPAAPAESTPTEATPPPAEAVEVTETVEESKVSAEAEAPKRKSVRAGKKKEPPRKGSKAAKAK